MKRTLLMPVSLILLLGLSLGPLSFLPDAAAGDNCVKESLIALGGTTIQGEATLCADDQGVRAKLKPKALTPGNAYTVWFNYIDNPSLCSGGPGVCGPADLGVGNPSANPLGTFGRLDSTVAENGKADFSGRVGGLRFSSGSQVWLLLYSHGPANTSDNRRRARQLLTPEDPPAGPPNLGNVVDGPGSTANAIVIFDTP